MDYSFSFFGPASVVITLVWILVARWRRRAERGPFVVDYKRIPFPDAVAEIARVWPWRGIHVRLKERDGEVERLEARLRE